MTDGPPPLPPEPDWQPPVAEPPSDRHPLPPRDAWDTHGWQMQPPPAQAGTDGFAIAALVLGILPVCAGVLGIVFGFVSLSRLKTSRQGGRRLAIAGIVCGFGWIAVLVAVAVIGTVTSADRDSSGAITSSGSVDATELRIGDCVDQLPKGDVYHVKAVPCGAAHAGEVYDVFALDRGSFPGESEVEELVSGRCMTALPGFTGAPAAADGYDIYYLLPLRRSWSIDRGATCLVASDDGSSLTGSVRSKGARPRVPSTVAPGALRGELSVEDLEVGNCVSTDVSESSTGTLDVVPCAEAHLSEVFSTYDLPAGPYPGDARVEALVVGHCRKWLPPFVRAPVGRTGYAFLYYSPDAKTWAVGDRRATCLLEDPDGDELVGEAKFKGARR